MNIFICWSGRRGQLVAEALEGWLHRVFPQCVKVHVSTNIEKGAIWRDELEKFLLTSRAGLLCLTPEALASPWVNFEAGFLARAIGAVQQSASASAPAGQLFTFLLGAKASDLTGPLAAFQSTDANDQRDTERLVKALMRLIPEQERSRADLIDQLTKTWPQHWADLRQCFAVIPKAALFEVCPHFAELFRRKTFEEPIDECMSQEWLTRYCGARDTLQVLTTLQPRVEGACRRYVRELWHALTSEIDAYANCLSQLIGNSYEVGDDGKLQIAPPGLTVGCEKRRCAVRRLVARLEEPPPFFDEAVHFDAAESLQEARNFVHRVEPTVRDFSKLTKGERLAPSWPEQGACFRLVRDSLESQLPPRVSEPRTIDLDLHWRTSRWAFDRVMYAVYLRSCLEDAVENHGDPDALTRRTLDFADEQLDVVRSQILDAYERAPASFAASVRWMPLQCALASIEAAGRQTCTAANERRIRELTHTVLELLDEKEPQHGPVRLSAQRLRARVSECLPRSPKPKAVARKHAKDAPGAGGDPASATDNGRSSSRLG